MKLSIIIPVYNEEKSILKIIKKCEAVDLSPLNFEKEIIIVDDGSTDNTRSLLQNIKNHKVIFHEKNLGKGAAIKTALNYVTGDYVIIQDADLEYDPNDYLPILECAIKNNASVVYGSRYLAMKKNKGSFLNYFGRIFLTRLANLLYKTNITDINTCYKLFKTDLIKSFNLESKGFEFCAEVTAQTAKRKIPIFEVPIKYFPRTIKEGKKLKLPHALQFFFKIFEFKWKK